MPLTLLFLLSGLIIKAITAATARHKTETMTVTVTALRLFVLRYNNSLLSPSFSLLSSPSCLSCSTLTSESESKFISRTLHSLSSVSSLGKASAFSHLETDLLDTPSISASSFCESPLAFLASNTIFENSILFIRITSSTK